MPVDDRHLRAAQALNLEAETVRELEVVRGMDPERLAAADESVLRRVMRRMQYSDLATARAMFRMSQQRDESGGVKESGLAQALVQLDSARARGAARRNVAGVPVGSTVESPILLATAGLVGGARWQSLGPGNVGGRTRSLVVHPQRPDTIWAGSVGGGLWRTDDGGVSWNPVDDFMANLAVTCMVMHPQDPDTLYAGTGEGFDNADALRGAGVFMTDDGAAWRQLASTNRPEFQRINRLAISMSGATLLVGTPDGIWRSDDPDHLQWEQVLHEPVADVKCDPADEDRAVAGGHRTGIAYFTSDGGRTWSVAEHGPEPWGGRIEVAYAAADSSVVYASIDIDNGQIWRSSDGGQTYVRRATTRADGTPIAYLADQGWYDNVIWAGDPDDSGLVIVGGIDLWRSTDAGDTLVDISLWYVAGSAHADNHGIVSDAGFGAANRRVYFTNDGGVFRADDVDTVGNDPNRTDGWTELVNTYEVTQFYSGAGNADTGVIIGGAQDNGTVLYDPNDPRPSENWRTIYGGDGGWCAADPTDSNYLYGEYVYLNIHRNHTGGAADSEFISGNYWDGVARRWRWKPAPYTIDDARTQRALFIAPFVLDPNNADRLLAGGTSLWRTNNAKAPNTNATGPKWERIKTSAGSPISALAVARGNSDVIWVGHERAEIFRTSNGTANFPAWSRVGSALPRRYCTSIVIDPNDSATVYVTFGGYSHGNIWKTADAGATWKDLGGSLPEAPIRAVAIHHSRRDFIYIGTEVGVFASENGGMTWSPTNEGPTNCSVDDLFWLGTRLICATHGRGMFEIDLP
jgi:photosystem II stability/assembly factor-like uncharacterized protein